MALLIWLLVAAPRHPVLKVTVVHFAAKMAQIDCFVALVEVIESLVYSHLILFAFMHNHLHHVLAATIQ